MMGRMTDYRHGPHSVHEIPRHLVRVTKYRKPVLTGAVGARKRDLIRGICGACDVQIIKGDVSKNHVHQLSSISPPVTTSRLVQGLKGKAAYKLLGESAHIREEFSGRHLWARGYFCSSVGDVTEEVVASSCRARHRAILTSGWVWRI